MKRISIILMAFALTMTMSQCKKNEGQTTSNDEVVTITLDVKQNNGSKVVVNPNTGTVDFETGDKIYVGSGGKYVGFLTHNGTNFVGNITNPTEGQPLQFYFLGNVTPQETLSAGTTEECSVIISDQTEHLPVISCAASNENYVSGVTAYSAHLLNKCALVKFNVTTPSNSPICITGMKNKVTVDFTQNTMTPSLDGEGIIKLPAGSGENVEKWAILLPQEALGEGEEGSAYTENGAYSGTRGAVPTIDENGYFNNGIDVNVASIVSLDHECVDLGLPSGTLWATCNVGANAPEEYGDYFAWGETIPKDYYDWSSYQYCMGSSSTFTKYCCNSSYGYNGFTDNLTNLLSEDDAAVTIWGGDWRIPTKAEWVELYNNTTVTWTTQNGVNGMLFVATNGNNLFLPASGARYESMLIDAGNQGYYWSSSLNNEYPNYEPYNAEIFYFHSIYYGINGYGRFRGHPIRPVRSVPQNNTPIGAIDGLFTINENGDQVYFSQGNLQYQASTNTWRFAENQWDYVGDGNANISQTYNGWIDLYSWGTSGWDNGNLSFQPYDIAISNNSEIGYGYGPTDGSNYDYDLTGSYANADWGVFNAITNGGNSPGLWFTLTGPEWDYVFNTRYTSSGIRFVKGTVNGVDGMILLPDNWSTNTYVLNNGNNSGSSFSANTMTVLQWIILEQAGAVFLPAASYRYDVYVNGVSTGHYWSASSGGSGNALSIDFNNYGFDVGNSSSRYYGNSVRLVQDYNP